MKLEIDNNRSSRNWTFNEFLGRFLWWICGPLFRLSPPKFWIIRNVLLRIFGAKIGVNVRISNQCIIQIPWNIQVDDFCGIGDRVIVYALGKVKIGARSTLSQGAHLCAGTHDYSLSHRPLVKANIAISSDVWVCADAFIGPNVSIGEGAIIGARSVVMYDIKAKVMVTGNPAKIIKSDL